MIKRTTIATVFAAIGSPCLVGADEAHYDPPLYHEELFGPQKDFPYFENCNRLQIENADLTVYCNAAFLAQCSLLTYVLENEYIEATLAKAGFESVRFFATQGSFAFLAESKTQRILVFRGSEAHDHQDFLVDIEAGTKRVDKRGKAHRGFQRAFGWIEGGIQTELELRIEDAGPKPLWVTGHSLGAALATLWTVQNPDKDLSLYTFGSPRVVDRSLAEHLSKTFFGYRFCNNTDIVTMLPPPPAYEHVGNEFFITSELQLLLDPSHLQKFRSSLRGRREYLQTLVRDYWSKQDFRAIPTVAWVDHSPVLYAKHLIEICLETENLVLDRVTEAYEDKSP